MTAKPVQRRRRDMTEADLLAVIENSAREGSWNAAAWLLERRWPERWVKPSSRIVEREEREPEPQDPFADVVDIAKARRPR